MTWMRVLLARLRGTLSGRRREDELREELETHLALLADEHRRRGLPDAEARLAARRELGGIAQTREAFRDTRVLPGIDALRQDVRFAWRALMRDRGTTIAAIALLTIGVSSTVVLVDVVDRLLLRPPSHVDAPMRLHRIYVTRPGDAASPLVTNYVTMTRLGEQLRGEVDALACFMTERIGSGHGADATRFEGIAFSESYFDVLGLTPALGVLPTARRTSDEEAVVISHALWQQRYGGAPDVIGRGLRLGQRSHTIVAVGPRGFAGIDSEPVDVWVPLASRRRDREWRTGTHYFGVGVIARLATGVDRERVERHATQIFNVVQRIDRPAGLDTDARITFGPLPPGQAVTRSPETRVLLAIAAVATLVLLMACGNVANLLVLAGLRRTSELTLKAALGAGRARLLREVFLQAVLLAGGSGAAAFLLVLTIGTVVRRALLPPLAATITPFDGRLVLLVVAICAIVALVLGVAPALRLTHLRVLTPGRAVLGRTPSRLLDTFVAIQVALSVPLLVGTALFAISFWNMARVDLGLEPGRVVAVRADMVDDGRPAAAHEVHRRIQARLAALPGVAATALAQSTPLSGGFARFFGVAGAEISGSLPFVNGVDITFLDVMGMRLIQGRAFTSADNRAGASPVTIINEAMARRFWPGRSAVGACIQFGETACLQVIGVVARASPWATPRQVFPDNGQFFVPIDAFPALNSDRVLLVRTVGDAHSMLARLRTEAQASAPDLPYVDATALDAAVQEQLQPLRLGWSIFLGLSGLALTIAIAGLVVVTAHGVTRRTREMGIRLVLGATPRHLIALMARRTLIAMGCGLAAGTVLSFAGAGLLRSVLFGIEPGEPRIFAAALAVLFVFGAVATYLPASRTARIDPSAALRTD